MKVTATREEILGPVQNVIGVVERRQTMPVLSNVLLSARNNRLSVTGTDLEVELVSAVTITVGAPRAPPHDLPRSRALLTPLQAAIARYRAIYDPGR